MTVSPRALASPHAARCPRVCGQTGRPKRAMARRAWVARAPRGGTALKMATAGGLPAKASNCWVAGTVSRSRIWARHGMTTRWATRAASNAADSDRGGVSITTKSTPCSAAAPRAFCRRDGCTSMTTGSRTCRRSRQRHALACGSVSNTMAVFPAPPASTASARARLVFPAPPFCASRARICIDGKRIQYYQSTCIVYMYTHFESVKVSQRLRYRGRVR